MGDQTLTYLIAGALLLIAAVVAALVLRASRRGKVLPAASEQPLVEAPRDRSSGLQAAPEVVRDRAPAAEAPTAWREGLARTRGGFVSRIAGLLSRKEIDPALLGQLEEVLLTADIGMKTSQKLFASVRDRLDRGHLRDSDAVWQVIREESRQILAQPTTPLDLDRAKPFVLLVLGVNGVGKTTTIGKLAARFSALGKKVLLAAGDTFRAAATEQLEVWGERTGAPVVKGRDGGDPSSVIFDAIRRAKAENYDIVICDTAGRLHTKTDLMEELQKVRRVMHRASESAPHETFLVLDATNGQNAILQAQMFKQVMDVTGIVLTKLDGTAKGGVILGICDELKLPVRFVGIGEKVADLREFDASAFVDALFAREGEAA